MGTAIEMPEWKKYITGGAKASYGKKEQKSLIEQRQGLPIYRLKAELTKVSINSKYFLLHIDIKDLFKTRLVCTYSVDPNADLLLLYVR